MAAGRRDEVIARIGGSWAGPGYLAGRAITYDSQGYDPILLELREAIVRTVRPGVRSSAAIAVVNELLKGYEVGEHHRLDRLEGRDLDLDAILTWSSVRELFRGVIRAVDVEPGRVVIEAADHSRRRSKKLGALVDIDTWPSARPSDVGQPIPLPINSPVDVFCPVVEEPKFTTLAQDIASDDTLADGVILGELPEGWPSSGTVVIDDEELTYTAVDETGDSPVLTGITRAANSTTAQEHRRGVPVYVADELKVAFDASGRSSSLTRIRAVGRDGRRYSLTRSGTVATENSTRIVTFTRPPLYLAPSGPKSLYAVPLTDNSSTVDEPQNALTGENTFTEAAFATIEDSSSAKDLIGRRVAPLPSLGQLEAAVVRVTHSGNQGESGDDNFSRIGAAEVWAGGQLVGSLSANDSILAGLRAIQGGTRRQPVQIPVEQDAVTQGSEQLYMTALNRDEDVPGFNELPTWLGADEANTIDGDLNNFGTLKYQPSVGTNKGRTRYACAASGVPGYIDTASTLDKVRLIVKHGGNGENPANGGTLGLIIEYLSITRSSGSDVPRTTPANYFIDYSPAGLTVADLADMVFFLDAQTGAFETSAYFTIYEVFLQIDFTPPMGEAIQVDTGNVENHILVPASIIPGIASVPGLDFQIRGDESNAFRVYSLDLALLYTPLEPQVVDRFVADIAGALTGTPAEVIDELWTTDAGNAASTISASDVSAAVSALTTAGFTAANFRGAIRHEELWEVIQAIARESRLRVYLDLGVLRMAYIPDLSAVADGTKLLTDHDALGEPDERGAVSEEQVLNKLTLLYDRTDLEGARKTEVEEDASSQTAYGVREEELEARFLAHATPAAALTSSLVERRARPFAQMSMTVLPTDSLIAVALLDVLKVAMPALSSTQWEIEEIRENPDGTRTLTGILLT